MAKTRAKTSTDEPIQLTLDELLDKQPNRLVEWSFVPDDIGGELLGILSKGLYPDPLDCIREYVQNSVDAQAGNVTIKITGNSVIITDDGAGMDLDNLVQARRLGLSGKSRTENVGFRGIGIYSGFDICNRLLITTKKVGEAKARVLEFDFGEMKAQLKAERDSQSRRTSLTELLTKYSHFKQEEDQVDRHYTIVQLEELSRVHIGQLADHERLRTYILHNLPIDFADNFPYKDQINSQLRLHVPGYNAVKVKLVTDFAPPEVIVRPNIPNLLEPVMLPISNADGKKIAFYWACLHGEGKEIPDQYSEYRGLVYKVKGFTIGNRSPLRARFTTAKGTLYDWYTGEVYVIDENVVPNAARNDFEASTEKMQLEAAVREEMYSLNKRASSFQEQKNADKDFARVSTYIGEVERKVGSYNLKQCSEALLQLDRYIDTLPKKKKKTTFNQNFVEETIQRAEKLRSVVRQMIDHPDSSSKNQSSASKPSLADTMPPPFPVDKQSAEPAVALPEPVSTATTTSVELMSNVISSPRPTPSVVPSPEPKPSIASSPQPTPKVASLSEPKPNVVSSPQLMPAKTLIQIFEQSGLEISGSCIQLIQIIDRSLSSVLVRETYNRVLDDIEVRLDYEVTGEIEAEDE